MCGLVVVILSYNSRDSFICISDFILTYGNLNCPRYLLTYLLFHLIILLNIFLIRVACLHIVGLYSLICTSKCD